MKLIRWTAVVLASLAGNAAAQIAPPAGKTAGETYKNLTVLKDVPQSEFIPTMSLMSASLGVNCEFCHATLFDADTKATKVTGRNMIKMTLEINTAHFNGRPVVTCNTCHLGSSTPHGVPAVWDKTPEQIAAYKLQTEPAKPATASKPATPSEALPTVEQILNNYRKAVGGDAVKSTHLVGTLKSDLGQERTVDGYAVLPNKLSLTLGGPGPAVRLIVNEDRGWSVQPQATVPLPAESLKQAREVTNLFLPVKYTEGDAPRRVAGIEKSEGLSCYVVESNTPGGVKRLYFDQQTGLLHKVSSEQHTVLGTSPSELILEDYRDINGVKMPARMITRGLSDRSVYQFSETRLDAAIDPATFEPPPPPAKK